MGERYNARTDRYAILHRIANDPDMSAAEAARLFHVARHTVERWCREEGIPLTGHKAPRVSFVLNQKRRRRKRLTQELALLRAGLLGWCSKVTKAAVITLHKELTKQV